MSVNDLYAIIIVPIVISLLASMPGLVALRKTRNQKTRERADTIKQLQDLIEEQADAWREQHETNKRLQDEMDGLIAEVKCWRGVFDRWKVGISRLINQIEQRGDTPEWQPSDDDLDCLKQTIAKGIKK